MPSALQGQCNEVLLVPHQDLVGGAFCAALDENEQCKGDCRGAYGVMGTARLRYTGKVLVSSCGAFTLHSHAISMRCRALKYCTQDLADFPADQKRTALPTLG